MASISRRGAVWRVSVWRKGVRLTATRDTEDEARAWAAAEEARIDGSATPPPTVAAPGEVTTGTTVVALFDRYARQVSPGKDGGRWEKVRLLALSRYPVFEAPAISVDGAVMAEWRDERLKSVTPATVNRELNLISAVFTRAMQEWRLKIPVNPVHTIARPKSGPPRKRRVPDEDRAAIVKQLGWDEASEPTDINEWVAFAFCLALETMMRQGEILRLTWPNVHFDRRYAYLPKTKNGDDREVPLSSRALTLLAFLTPGTGRVVPIESGTCGAYFREACRGACVVDLHFHDSRHESITRGSKRLSNVLELGAVSGHRDPRSLKIYYNPDPTDLADKLG